MDIRGPFGTIGTVIVRCTRKLLDVIRPGQLADAPADGDDWYANLLRIDGRKCLLLTHADTLFTIFEPGVRAPRQDRQPRRPRLHERHGVHVRARRRPGRGARQWRTSAMVSGWAGSYLSSVNLD